MDLKHREFLKRWGVDIYNSYFNRDKKFEVEEIMDDPPRPKPMRSYVCNTEVFVLYDLFRHEYRDGDNAVPVPHKMDRWLVEPLPDQYNVPLEYIREHGALEFILVSDYPYSLLSLFYYSKVVEYQNIYLEELVKQRRLTQYGNIITSLDYLL